MIYVMIAIGFVTAYINGMHDGGTVVATSVTARIMAPRAAVVWSGICNFIGGVTLGTAVAYTVGADMIDADRILGAGGRAACLFIIAAFLGSMAWNIVTWIVKLPSSASHSLMGSLVGCMVCACGAGAVHWNAFMIKVVAAMVLSPVLGFVFGWVLQKLEQRLLRRATMVWDRRIRILDIVTTMFVSLTHGSNDAQKVIGLTAIGICAARGTGLSMDLWLIIMMSAGIALGTMTGGFNMIGTLGRGIVKMNVDRSFTSHLSAAAVMEIANVLGLPVSSTQVLTGTVIGVGTEDRPRSVNWGILKNIAASWILMLPASGLMGYLVYFGLSRALL